MRRVFVMAIILIIAYSSEARSHYDDICPRINENYFANSHQFTELVWKNLEFFGKYDYLINDWWHCAVLKEWIEEVGTHQHIAWFGIPAIRRVLRPKVDVNGALYQIEIIFSEVPANTVVTKNLQLISLHIIRMSDMKIDFAWNIPKPVFCEHHELHNCLWLD